MESGLSENAVGFLVAEIHFLFKLLPCFAHLEFACRSLDRFGISLAGVWPHPDNDPWQAGIAGSMQQNATGVMLDNQRPAAVAGDENGKPEASVRIHLSDVVP